MRTSNRYISLITSTALLWMIILPVLSVCGMMPNLADAKATAPISCCPIEATKQVDTSTIKMCHPTQDSKTHSCEGCSCEFRASMATVKSVSMIAPESQESLLPVLFSLMNELLVTADTEFHPPSFLQNISPDSGPPVFIRNCTWLI